MPNRIRSPFPIYYRVESREIHGEGYVSPHRKKDTGQVGRSYLPPQTFWFKNIGKPDAELVAIIQFKIGTG